MTVRELIEKLQQYPGYEEAEIELFDFTRIYPTRIIGIQQDSQKAEGFPVLLPIITIYHE